MIAKAGSEGRIRAGELDDEFEEIPTRGYACTVG
jgi:hypothetical protein